MSNSKRNNGIVYCRIIGMIMIVLCHIIRYYTFIPGSAQLNNFFGMGVDVFLFISGYLYGKKQIDNFPKWYLFKLLKIALPVTILSAVYISVRFASGQRYSILTVVMNLLNLQGLDFFFHFLFGDKFENVAGLAPLWFSTLIMICYLFVPILNISGERMKKEKRPWGALLALTLIVILITVISGFANTIISSLIVLGFYIFKFAFGYYCSKIDIYEEIKRTNKKRIVLIWAAILPLALLALRIVLRKIFDDTTFYSLYSNVATYITGVALIYIVFCLADFEAVKSIKPIADNKFIKYLERISMSVYMVHDIVIYYVYHKPQFGNNIWIKTIAFIILTLIIASLFDILINFINSKIVKVIK